MQVGDWIITKKGSNFYISCIDFFSRDGETVYVTILPLPITLTANDKDSMRRLMIDLALLTKDEKWFAELTKEVIV